jgi:undecaprenyl-diphosphatase
VTSPIAGPRRSRADARYDALGHDPIAEEAVPRNGSARKVWPLDRRAGKQLLVAYLAIGVVLAIVGLLLVHVLDHTAVVRFDVRVSKWFERQRTPLRNEFGQVGAGLADAYTLTPAVILLSIAFLAVWKRWHDVIMFGGVLLMEKALFLPVTLIVGRDRPPVVQLDGAPPTSSYPSGHVAAGMVAYVALAIVIRWHFRNRIVRDGVVVLAVVAPVSVAVARLYLGMHHVTDVLASVCYAAVCLLVMHRVLTRAVERLAVRHPDLPERARVLDLTAASRTTEMGAE